MKNFLENILTIKRREVEARKQETSLAALAERCREQAPPRPLAAELKLASEIALIGELKKASPSAGVIREDFEPEHLSRQYSDHGAAAISVLTEQHYFHGNLDYLRRVRQVVDVPLLCKDFLIDTFQIYEARAHGADVVLLIVAAIAPKQLVELHQVSLELGMEAMVEVHSEAEMAIAKKMDARLIGINNRDLTTFEVDPATTVKLARLAVDGAAVVAESGIRGRGDVEALSDCCVDAVLVGEALMRSSDLGAALRSLQGVAK